MSVARSSFVMFLGTFVSRLLGLVRSPLLFAIAVGVNFPAGNAFDVANRLPTLIYMLVAGGVVNAVLVPAIVRAASRESDGGSAYINKLVTLGVVVLGGITAVLTLASPLLIKLFASGLSGQWYSLAVLFAYLCVPQVFFYGMYTLLGQILNAKENFGPYMWAPALNNIVAIAGLVIIITMFGRADPSTAWSIETWPMDKALILGGSATAGIIAQALILLVPLYRMGVRLKPDFAFRGAGLGSAARSGGWVLMSLAFGMIPTILISNVASTASNYASNLPPEQALGVAGNAAYTVAYSLYSLPTSLVVVSIVTAMFTRMATKAAAGDMAGVGDDTSLALRVVSVFSFLATALIIVLAIPAVRLISPGSSWQEVDSIAAVLVAMSLGLVGVGSFTAIQRVYYAMEMAKQLFFVQIPFVVLQSVLVLSTLLFSHDKIVVGVGLSMAVANTLTPIAALARIRGKLEGFDTKRLLATYAKLVLITAITGLAGWGLNHRFGSGEVSILGAITRILIITPVMVIIFLGLMKVMKLSEIAPLARILTRFTGKLGRRAGGQPTTLKTETHGGTVNGTRAAGQRIRDRYELVAPLASPLGGDFETWTGFDTVLGTDVRVILIDANHPDRDIIIDSARRGVFVEDVRLIKLLSIFDLDEYSAIITEIPEGTRLSDILSSEPIGHEQSRAITGEVAGALDAGVRCGVRLPLLRPELVTIDDAGSLFVDGIGIDAPMSAHHDPDALSSDLDRTDARNLALLLASCLLGKTVGDGDEAQFLTEASQADVPAELADLLSTTAEGHGPVSTGDFIRAIVPWGTINRADLPTVTEPEPEAESVEDGEESVDTSEEAGVDEAPATAVLAASETEETADQEATAVSPVVGETAENTPPPPPPSMAVKEPGQWEQAPSWDEVNETSDDKRSINPTTIILAIAAISILIFGFLAFKILTRDTSPVTIESPETTVAEDITVVEDDPTEEPTTEEPTEESEPELPAPTVASVTLLNPQAAQLNPATVDQQDAPQDVPNMIDGNPATVWSSWWYSDPGFWMKDGIGLEITLAEEAQVSEVVLNVNGEGGLVQWRDTEAASPNTGDVYAEGPMSAETVLSVDEPVAANSVVLWFEDLPTAPDGQFRIEISELTVR